MEEPIEETYFNWLYAKVAYTEIQTPATTYYTLFRDLHSIEFVWLVTGDDNRAEEGLELRKEFLRQFFMPVPGPFWLTEEASVLEMLIAFAKRAEFNTSDSMRDWFWEFLENLGLNDLCDARYNISQTVAYKVERLIWRTYRRDGLGGLFPMKHPEHDQRKVELWYQFCEYLVENDRH